MDDLSGLDWTSGPNGAKPQSASTRAAYSSLQPTSTPGLSGSTTPLNLNNLQAQNSGKVLRPISKPTTPANDPFASLSGSSPNKSQGLSLQERQRQVQEEKARKDAERRQQYVEQYGDQQSWNALSGTSLSPPVPASPLKSGLASNGHNPFAAVNGVSGTTQIQRGDDVDLFAAFSADAPVDKSSHFPPPLSGSGTSTPANSNKYPPPKASNGGAYDFNDDDDTFGLGRVKLSTAQPNPTKPASKDDDDDILGMLGRPVSDIPKPASIQSNDQIRTVSTNQAPETSDHPQARAVSELVDMGFPADKAADALAQTESGINVQAAVGILLNSAHEESRSKARGRSEMQQPSGADNVTPPWKRRDDDGRNNGPRRSGDQSPGPDKDIAKQAQDIGASLFKSANSLWKTGQRKVQKAVAEFQAPEGDQSQPKWMREAQMREATDPRQSRMTDGANTQRSAVTNEAALLEGGGRPPKPQRSTDISRSSTPASGDWNDIPEDMLAPRRPGTSRTSSSRTVPRPSATRLTRQEIEDSTSDMVVSSSRRRRPPPAAASSPSTRDASPALTPSMGPTKNPFAAQPPPPKAAPKSSTPLPSRPKAPPRQIPTVSSLALQNSSQQRGKGSESFKRGDYATAHTHYTSALQGIPQSHPISIVIFCNRALTSLKNGDPRAAVCDADLALGTIGASRGEGEKIPLGGNEGEKNMKEFFAKALMRKAEALENLEKWADAGKVWKEAVEAGVGGPVAIQGRNRCEKAAAPASRPPARKPMARPAVAGAALSALQGANGMDSDAVRKMREANAAAAKADDEKFALTESIDAKLVAWKGTKSDNLRALLGSLDQVLWPEAGWAKVGMQDLVMPNRVKIIYMKAIAKVHPDKISQTATTEQRMISASVFATLNEAWDKFKTDNGL